MANIKRNFIQGIMNKSLDERLVPNGQYVDALNIRLGSTEDSEIGSVELSKGNTQLSSLEYNGTALSNNAKCIGACEDSSRETIYWFVHDPSFSVGATRKLDLIVSLDVKDDILTYHVVSIDDGNGQNTTLNFNPEYLITGVDFIGTELLYFTDDYNAPRYINVKRNYASPISNIDQFSAEEILVIKKPPVTSPAVVLSTIPENEDFLEDRFLCFAYRYRYADNQYSAISQFSEPAFAPQFFNTSISSFLNEGMQNDFNNAIITMNSGGPLVKGFDLLFKESTGTVIKVVKKFDKQDEGIADNVSFSYNFSNSKIFTVLPEAELLRTFDNVPTFAKAQTFMGNRLVYGNYKEGYDLKTLNGQNIRLDFTTSLESKEVSSTELNTIVSASNTVFLDPAYPTGYSVSNGGFRLDFFNAATPSQIVELTKGSVLSLELDFEHDSFTQSSGAAPNQQQQSVTINFDYVLPQDFLDDATSTGVYKLATSSDFQEKLGIGPPTPPGTGGSMKPVYDPTNPTSCSGFTLTDIVNCFIQEVLTTAGPTTYTKYVGGIDAVSPPSLGSGFGDVITSGITTSTDFMLINMPAIRRVDDVVTPTIDVYEYFSVSNVRARLRSSSNIGSLHSNRNYEVGIIYMDDFNRATTALVSDNNTVHTLCANSIDQNKIIVDIPTTQIAPSFATRYKFCIKPDKRLYETVYSNFYVQDPSTSDTYILLEGENTRKVEEGDTLTVKRDVSGAITYCQNVTVLEKKAQEADWLDPPPTDSSGAIPVPGGTYIKISGTNVNVRLPEGAVVSPGQQDDWVNLNNNPDQPQLAYTGLGGFDIPERTRIVLKFRFERLGTGEGTNNCERRIYDYEQTFFSSADYADIIEWFDGDGIGGLLNLGDAETGDGSVIQNIYLPGVDTSGPSGSSPSYGIPANQFANQYKWYRPTPTSTDIRFILQGPIRCGSSKKKRSTISCEWQIFRSENLLVFETQPSDAEPDLWYESSDSYAIDPATGYHEGNTQNQTATQSAIVTTDFINCYAFGNGVESYKILDSIVGKPIQLGERFFSTSAEEYKEAHRFADLTYSGVFNDETNVDRLNEFNLGLANFKTLEDSFGAVQLIDGRETDILVLQEDKISYVLAGKNLLSDSTGGGAIASVPEVLGTQIARVEEYGISENPESYVQWGFNKFFTDAKRGAVIQLRGQGQGEQLTVISEAGMRSWFRDLFIGSGDTQKIGAFDPYMNEYVLSSNNIKLPAEEVVLNCGVKRRLTVTAASPVSFTVNLGNLVGVCDIDYDIISFSDPGSITIAEDYTGTSVSPSTTGTGTLAFAKDSVIDEDVVVTLTPASSPPGGKQTVVLDITVNCPAAQEITLIEFCVSKDNQALKTIHNEYLWTDGSYTSPLKSKQVTFPVGDRSLLTEEVADYTLTTAQQGGAIIPNDGDTLTIRSVKKKGDTYDFDFTGPNRLMFCRSNTLYPGTTAGYGLLLADPNLQVLTVTTPTLGTVEGDITIPSSTDQYMYIIYDYFS
jgi:hypothetical protein